PIIAIQVENEYASYGDDTLYLEFLERTLRSLGIDVLLFTSDNATAGALRSSAPPHLFKAVNFGRDVERHFTEIRAVQATGPLMCAELWLGWYDIWGEAHQQREADDAARTFEEVVKSGASVNLYMFHGGCNFGFRNGAMLNNGCYRAVTTSYDYDAPLDE